jgi:hypothetical protein
MSAKLGPIKRKALARGRGARANRSRLRKAVTAAAMPLTMISWWWSSPLTRVRHALALDIAGEGVAEVGVDRGADHSAADWAQSCNSLNQRAIN